MFKKNRLLKTAFIITYKEQKYCFIGRYYCVVGKIFPE